MAPSGWACIAIAVAFLHSARSSLPPAIGSSSIAPGELTDALTVPLLDSFNNGSLQINLANDPSTLPLPLIMMAYNNDDPWSTIMLFNNDSADAFLADAPRTAHYLFGGYDEADAAAIQTQLYSRLALMPSSDQDEWMGVLHFMNGTLTEVGGSALTYMQAWQSPINIVSLPDSPETGNLTRMDGHYGWCGWPDKTETSTIVDGGNGCDDSTELAYNCTGGCDWVLLTLDGSCTPEEAAKRASQLGGMGAVLLAQAPGLPMVEVGAASATDAMNVVVSMVSAETGATLASSIAAGGGKVPFYAGYEAHDGFFLAIDAVGRLQQVGWEKQPLLMHLGWAASYLDYVASVEESLAEPALTVPIMTDVALKTSASATVTLPLPLEQLRAEFSKMELDFALGCWGERDEDCSVWDHCITLTVACGEEAGEAGEAREAGEAGEAGTLSLDTTASNSNDFGTATPILGEPGGKVNEMWRGITTFRRRNGRWLTDVSPLFGLLTSQTCEFTMQTGGETWVAAELSLRFSGFTADAEVGTEAAAETTSTVAPLTPLTPLTPPQQLPSSLYNCVWDNPSTSFKSSAYNENRTLMIPIPANTARIQIVAIISGHGGCEFIPTSHHFLVEGTEYNTTAIAADIFMNAGSDYGCTDFVAGGASPNEHGTWYYGRNGWCDGLDIKPLVWEVDVAELSGASQFNLTYYALSYNVGGSHPSTSGCGGGILMSANVAFYQ